MNQTDQEKFTSLLTELGLTRRKLCEILDIEWSSMVSLLAPARCKKQGLPRWAKAMIVTWELMKNKS